MSAESAVLPDRRVVTRERLAGMARRWRRFGTPVAAGTDGDWGLFGPESIVWQVLLHPAVIVFQYPFQTLLQTTYLPVMAGVRDHDPLSKHAQAGTANAFDIFERGQRNSGMHAPMWLGDTPTATAMARHLGRIHTKVAGEVIDPGNPGLGGYAATSPRELVWAALTEMHSMLWAYEHLAFRDGRRPHRLSDADRDRFVAESAAYCRLVGAEEADIPHSMADLRALYRRDAHLFGHSDTVTVHPGSDLDFSTQTGECVKANFHRSQLRTITYLVLDHGLFKQIALGASPAVVRRNAGLGRVRTALAPALTTALLPMVWVLQQPRFERHWRRLMWGPDGVDLIGAARAASTSNRPG